MAETASTADAVVVMFASTADKAVAEAASTTDEASSADEAVAAHRLKAGGGSAVARTG